MVADQDPTSVVEEISVSRSTAVTKSSEFAEFLDRHEACIKARPWASRYETLQDAWENCPNPAWLLWALDRAGFSDEDALLAWASACVGQILHLLLEENSRRAVATTCQFLK